jgi:uncharacterized cofD-like protein
VTRVVAIGGGHGLAATLRAVVPWADQVTAVVSTADDGGSSGRLREQRDLPGVGDLRRCLTALADPGAAWTRALERRFDTGELAGHPTGNLVLLALTEELGDLQAACDELARTASIDPARARVVPVTDAAVVLHGRSTSDRVVTGQVSVADTPDLSEVWVEPVDAPASAIALDAIRSADLVLVGPGSLYTSVLAALVVGDVRKALADTHARIAYVANLRADQREAHGYDLAAHVAALGRHGVQPAVVIAQSGALPGGPIDADVLEVDVAGQEGHAHDPAKLAAVLASLV